MSTWIELDPEVKPQEFVGPLMLWNCGEPLVEQELEAVMVRAHQELPTPKIRAPVAHCLDQANELTLVRRQLGMAGSNLATEESNGADALIQDRPKPRPRCVALHDEGSHEVWKLQDRGRSKRVLERLKGSSGFRHPEDGLLPHQLCQGRHDGPVVLYEAPVIACEAEEAADSANRPSWGHAKTASTLAWSIATPSSEITWPKYAKDGWAKKHVLRLRNN